MRFDEEILKYLKGEKFSNSLKVELGAEKHVAKTRESVITDLIKDRNVIHIGCSDHVPLIVEKIALNRWLHKLITENSKNCLGIDINKESIDFLVKELGYKNVIYGNIITDTIGEIFEKEWDYAVFGEIIEHLDNPVDFLRSFREKYHKNISDFIITVPNIYCKISLNNMFNYNETINSDHRFWFTPYTISKVLVSAGYKPEKINYANLLPLNNPELVSRKIRQILGISVKFPFYYFKTLIISGTII
jgi:hypothetical protein